MSEGERNRKISEQKKFNQIDWQKKRLPELARFVNSIYTSHKVNTMKKEKLIANVRFVGYRSINIESDVDRLIKTSNNWLCEFRGWIKKNPI